MRCWELPAKVYARPLELFVGARLTPDGARALIAAGLTVTVEDSPVRAIPIEPYSHSPAHAGAQQPGMTGQVGHIIDLSATFRDISSSLGCV